MTDRERILIPYGLLTVGGIETLIVRFANYLAREGRDVVLISEGGPLAPDLDSRVRQQNYGEVREGVLATRQNLDPAVQTLVVTFDPFGAAFAYRLLGSSRWPNARVVAGIFHPRAYFFEDDRANIPFNRLIFTATRAGQFFFMNEECRRSHAAHFHRGLADSAIIPIGVPLHVARKRVAAKPPLRIASVGRLVRFKDYNRHIPAIGAELAGTVDFCWDIFGDGALRDEMNAEIDKRGLAERIETKGTCPPDELADRLSDYDVFVGMGTSALEAASLGIPTIVAVDQGGDRTYGYLHELPLGNVGERLDSSPGHRIADLIADLAQMRPTERQSIGDRCRQAALRHSMENYVAAVLDLARGAPIPNPLKAWLAGVIYQQANHGLLRRSLRWTKRLLLDRQP